MGYGFSAEYELAREYSDNLGKWRLLGALGMWKIQAKQAPCSRQDGNPGTGRILEQFKYWRYPLKDTSLLMYTFWFYKFRITNLSSAIYSSSSPNSARPALEFR
jgi:hypothetical protein